MIQQLVAEHRHIWVLCARTQPLLDLSLHVHQLYNKNIREESIAYSLDHLELLICCTVTKSPSLDQGPLWFFEVTQAKIALVGTLMGLHERFVDNEGLLTIEKGFFVFFDLDIWGSTICQDCFVFDKIYKVLKPSI